MKTTGTYNLIGAVPDKLRTSLVSAIQSVPSSCFFDVDGGPSKNEIREFDAGVAMNLRAQGYAVESNFCPFSDNAFNVDLALPKQKLLIEIEKGKQPRLELDILKIASACSQFPDRWSYGALVVPASYIKLKLAGEQAPYIYLKRLKPLIQPLFTGLVDRAKVRAVVEGFIVIGYDDPR